MDTPCPQCSAPVSPGTKFCGQCGYDLVNRPPVGGAAAAAPEVDPKKTVMGGFAPVPTKPAASEGGAPRKRDFAKTVMDAGPPPAALADLMDRADDPTTPDATPAKPAAPPSAKPVKKAVQRTMMGMAAVPPQAMAPASEAELPDSPASAPGKPGVQRTMLGMAAVPPAATPATPPGATPPDTAASAHTTPQSAPQSPQPAPQSAPQPGPSQPKPAPQTNRTMLGVAAPVPGAQPQPIPKGVPAAKSNRTMLGQPATAPAGGPGGPQFTAEPMPSDPNIPGLSKRKSGVPWVGILIGLGLVVGIGAGAAWWMFGRGPELRASIANSPEGEVLQVDVPGMPEGTKARFQGREVLLEAGRATFPLAANDLQLGDNSLTVDVVSPDGTVEQGSVVLSVKYRVRADLNSLQSDPPTLRILVDAKPGSTVTIDERNVELDPTGHGFVDLPIDPEAEANVYERSISYRVVVDGEPASGTVETQVPFATLQIDRPGATTVTDEARIELAGVAHPEATVSLDGTTLETTEGRFVTHLDVPELGEKDFTVIARRPGRAPRARGLHVQRVEDLEAYAASFPVDDSLTYARITQNPESYRGQSAAFVGRVYNVDVHQGKTVLQIVVRDCPRGQRCPMWVTFDGASSAENNSWVRVVGHIGGEQQFRSPSGQVMSVPRLDAVFVLPTDVGRR